MIDGFPGTAGAEERTVLLSSHPPGRSPSGSRSTWAAATLLGVCLMAPPSPTICGQFLAANLSVPLAGSSAPGTQRTGAPGQTHIHERHLNGSGVLHLGHQPGRFRALRTCLHG